MTTLKGPAKIGHYGQFSVSLPINFDSPLKTKNTILRVDLKTCRIRLVKRSKFSFPNLLANPLVYVAESIDRVVDRDIQISSVFEQTE